MDYPQLYFTAKDGFWHLPIAAFLPPYPGYGLQKLRHAGQFSSY